MISPFQFPFHKENFGDLFLWTGRLGLILGSVHVDAIEFMDVNDHIDVVS